MRKISLFIAAALDPLVGMRYQRITAMNNSLDLPLINDHAAGIDVGSEKFFVLVGGKEPKVFYALNLLLTTILLTCWFPRWAQAQAPGLVWSASLGARLFAVDAQTNVYANSGGTVFTIGSAGALLATNNACRVRSPAPVTARLDGSGNFYFLGNFDGTQDFGGIVLVGGWINWPSPGHWTPGYPTCFLAKYSGGGALQWVVSFGGQAVSNAPTDLLLDSASGVYPAYVRGDGSGVIACFSSSGAEQWETVVPGSYYGAGVTLGGLTSSNLCFFDFRYGDSIAGGRIGLSGNPDFWNKAGSNSIYWATLNAINGKPVIDDDAQTFQVGVCYNCLSHQVLRKWAVNGYQALTIPLGDEEQWTLARDPQTNVYLGGAAGLFAKYSSDAILIWTTNYGQMPVGMLVDAVGNRFLGFADGSVARVAAEAPPQPPVISAGPQSQTLFLGDSGSFSVAATGTQPLRYSWRLNATNLLNVTTSNLVFNSAAPSDAGAYTVVITNAAGSVTSAPAQLRPKSVELYAGSQMLSAGSYVFASPPTLSIRSALVNGSSFYTLDGSAPSFASIHYTGPFTLESSGTVRALGYSADFSASEEADPVYANVLASQTLTVTSSGGGWVNGGSPTSNAAPAGATSWWRGEANTLDSAGNNNGTAGGGLAYAPGAVGQSFLFNGTDANVTVPHSPALDVGLSNGMTMEAWFKPNSLTTPSALLEWFDPSWHMASYEGVNLTINIPANYGGSGSGCLVANFVDPSGASHVIKTPAGSFGTDRFTHAIVTYDHTSGLAAIYLNGLLVTQADLGIFTPETGSAYFNVVLGGLHYPVSGHIAEYFSGQMDETSLYGRALSASEAESLYRAQGGVITNLPSGTYSSTNVVTLVAMPLPGWSFLYWLGDASGTNSTINVAMERDKSIYAVFGTTLSTTVAGNGQVLLYPATGPYPYGSTVRLTAVPQPGYYFGFWGNATTGDTNPLYFAISTPTQTVSAIFGAVPAGEAALTVEVNGNGQVAVNPRANVYATNQSVTLTATANPEQAFLYWSGDASGSQSPLTVLMNQSRVITANFSGRPPLRAMMPGVEGLTSAGFRLTLLSDPQLIWQILGSTNFATWEVLGTVTNTEGEVQFTDPGALSRPYRFYRAAPGP